MVRQSTEATMVRSLLVLSPLLALAVPAGAQLAPMPTVSITESSFRIAPGMIHLAAGQPVRLVFTNLSGSGHDFTAPAFFGRAQILSGAIGRGEVDLPGHAQVVVTLVPVWPAPSRCDAFQVRWTTTLRASVLKRDPSFWRTVIVRCPVLLRWRSSTTPDLPAWVPPATEHRSPLRTSGAGSPSLIAVPPLARPAFSPVRL
jgi:hypothetical protein